MEIVQPLRTKREISAMKNALHGRDKLLFIFGINSGLRITDILGLTVGDVRDRDSIVLREEKTEKPKRFRINDAIKRAIAEFIPLDVSADEYLFRSRKGVNRPITRVQAYRILNDAAARAGITEQIGCHTLRKTFGYHAHKANVDLATLQAIFNHSSQAVTLRYIGITQDTMDEVYANIDL
ncbi:site-specific integrase [Brevibacillus laterosporus]|uniref:site-specific integrase n=1 Tax=Brevibacillus laterosporus TaxID=1465 RepID=UPI0018F894C6|nr:site-specific integrase [Brevibacillus laterosporus]